jgi:hypothetical protein
MVTSLAKSKEYGQLASRWEKFAAATDSQVFFGATVVHVATVLAEKTPSPWVSWRVRLRAVQRPNLSPGLCE